MKTNLSAWVWSLLMASLWCVHSAEILPPNIIVMMADDMGMGDTSAYQDFTGNADDVQIATPQMDRLARMGLRFTDAHTPSSRCTATRYGLLTGRYAWRNRMKHWVLFGSQGDPMIEADRPTLGTMLQTNGYQTALVGKWHVGLRYRQANRAPAAGWEDADLTHPLYDSAADHGFDFVRLTSRSHATSGPDAGGSNKKKNGPNQNVGPGHIHGRRSVSATGDGKALVTHGENAYVLRELGGRHSDSAIEFLSTHVSGAETRARPFFLYYPSNSNHGPYTPDDEIGGKPVAGAARTQSGKSMGVRFDYIYENDVALGRLLDWLEATEDPRRPGTRLVENTIVIFTSDNGAESKDPVASGPFRSHKGSAFEGGHRVPFMMSWPLGKIGDGKAGTPGATSTLVIGLQDLYATFAAIIGAELPDLRQGEKGAEDSVSFWASLSDGKPRTAPLFHNDHNEAEDDPAHVAIRVDSPRVYGQRFAGQWKLFFDAALLRSGEANPYALYDLVTDQQEQTNRVNESALKPLIDHMTALAVRHRRSGGHRVATLALGESKRLDWRSDDGSPNSLAENFAGHDMSGFNSIATIEGKSIEGNVSVLPQFKNLVFGQRGLGVFDTRSADRAKDEIVYVSGGYGLEIQFNHDVVVEWVEIIAGDGVCGGYYQVGDGAKLAIYCEDGDNDSKDQHGVLSDIGVLLKGEVLRLSSGRHFGVEPMGQWNLGGLRFSLLH